MIAHALLTRGGIIPQYARALETARVHGDVVLWTFHGTDLAGLPAGVEVAVCDQPGWLRGESPAHQFDVTMWRILRDEGGVTVPLDSISLRPAGDLLGADEAVVACDAAPGHGPVEHPYNNLVVCRPGADFVAEACERAERRVRDPGQDRHWGYTSVTLLTELVRDFPGDVRVAEYGALGGFAGSLVWRWYLGLEEPPENCRILHLFASAHPELFYEGRADLWLARHESFAEYLDLDALPWPRCVGAMSPSTQNATLSTGGDGRPSLGGRPLAVSRVA